LVGSVRRTIRQFDSAAEALASNGFARSTTATSPVRVIIPRLDSTHRSIDFAIEMQRIIERFNTQKDRELRLRVGINTGNVVSGLVVDQASSTTCGVPR